ncbi:LOW QUALITY PROTEIN: hypothetical protein RJ639_004484 [Escallonia herrerae]|uniref:DUF3741 domain-containing protein n=1 Tax=Escallonia herrerae TaxID=1293975 RepID=A0AA88W1Q2_9ASTE|nr:LOW QUALITY PROTEIN: hypothetical protein RJ639_004484 [Escallonia herrerae]
MKDLSFFLLKNSFGAKMKKGFKNFCNGDSSTSTLNQQKTDQGDSSPYVDDSTLRESQPTLEEMILQLDLEEKMARRAKLDDYGEIQHRVSDILRSARNALNQYPRFSLDGKDAMYRSSFRNLARVCTRGRKSSCGNHGLKRVFYEDGFDSELGKMQCLPATLAGECVVWHKPGVVAKLMGLEAMPTPISSKERLSSIIRKQNLRRRAERHEVERRHVLNTNGDRGGVNRGIAMGSCSATGYCVMKPIAVELPNDEAGWPMRRYL